MVNAIFFHGMETSNPKVPLFPCPDGIAGAWVCKQKYPNAKVLPLSYEMVKNNPNEFLNLVKKTKRVLFVDISIPPEVQKVMQSFGVKYKILDHHEAYLKKLADCLIFSGSIKDRLEKSHTYYDVRESGATLAWKHLFPDKSMPVFLEYIRDRDLFTQEFVDNTKFQQEVHLAMANLRRSFELFDMLAPMCKEELLSFLLPYGTPALQKRKEKIYKILAKKVNKKGHIAYIKLPKSYVYLKADMAMYLLQDNAELELVLIETPGNPRVSIKSRKYLNLLSIFYYLEELGGHPSAINFRPNQGYLKLIEETPLFCNLNSDNFLKVSRIN
jgi:hypothetical protein